MLGRQLEEWAGRCQDAGWRESWWPQWWGGGGPPGAGGARPRVLGKGAGASRRRAGHLACEWSVEGQEGGLIGPSR